MTHAHETVPALDNYDALLVLSFGGPEGNEEVVPFLENVTRGRGIPKERLKVVGKHYFHFDGVSPINRLNRELIANIEQELAERGIDLPVYFGNRNWKPFGTDAVDKMAADGKRNILVFATSAWAGYSACRQYHEDIQHLVDYVQEQGLGDIQFTKIRQFFDHPKFIAEMAEAVTESFAEIPEELRDSSRLVFTAHSVPTAHDDVSGPEGEKNLYSRQVEEASRLVAREAGVEEFDLVWNSRSGNPATPWLEPDVADHAAQLAEEGIKALVVSPIGFISDHMEVIWDLDTELAAEMKDLGMHLERTRTAGPSKRFQSMVVDLVEELQQGVAAPVGRQEAVARLSQLPVQGCTRNGQPCAAGCCDISPTPAP
ncbi:ferrochelatase [Corynebacterium phocae]|uniref:Coproporphyrin III ferrochelatase n=1 Tax=Corynebacterium phocae TaxID=161895 RepID=A0A1L7D3C9_9CORY|nr:ferrochelatase [Corynebacterium phocae]APT92511.1 ferrochelatase [Corynebacterium phocae]KAA8725115.1 ferrochelatase [Corynebacterium phocae]